MLLLLVAAAAAPVGRLAAAVAAERLVAAVAAERPAAVAAGVGVEVEDHEMQQLGVDAAQMLSTVAAAAGNLTQPAVAVA